jgi:drug/metabolite transporter (DMT)-like permease
MQRQTIGAYQHESAQSFPIAGSRRRLGMTRAAGGRVKTYVALLIMITVGPLGNVLLRQGMSHVTAPADWTARAIADSAARALDSGTIWLGIGCLITYLIVEMLVLSWADYSYVQPASAGAYIVVALLGNLLLDEHVSHLRWLGVCIIGLGVFIVGQTSPRTVEAESS